MKLKELYLVHQAFGLLCALFNDSEPVTTGFSRSFCCEFSQTGPTPLVITPSPPVLQLISPWGRAPSVLCCLTPTVRVWEEIPCRQGPFNRLCICLPCESKAARVINTKGHWACTLLNCIFTRNLEEMQKKWDFVHC